MLTDLQDFYQTTRSQTLMPGTQRVFRSIEQYQATRETGMGTKMGAVLNAAQHFLGTPCASIPKMDKSGALLPEAEQDAPYRTEPWDTPEKLLLYTKFTMNFPLIISVCSYSPLMDFSHDLLGSQCAWNCLQGNSWKTFNCSTAKDYLRVQQSNL
jgi:hypothetical protein